MTDLDALRLAVLAAPDDDLPRLVYADCAEENGDPEYAAFIRAQIELAKTPEYEPFAVHCHTRRPEWVSGEPWNGQVIDQTIQAVGYNVSPFFRRGFGWCIGLSGPR
ncbi:MAG: TIGR02996 domain-containing protein, partial [Gemmataceae bacterium]